MIDWKDKKVLVCGGAGMIGSHLAEELVKRGSIVTVVDNLSSGSIRNLAGIIGDVAFLEADLRDGNVCQMVTTKQDVIFQLAANMGAERRVPGSGRCLAGILYDHHAYHSSDEHGTGTSGANGKVVGNHAVFQDAGGRFSSFSGRGHMGQGWAGVRVYRCYRVRPVNQDSIADRYAGDTMAAIRRRTECIAAMSQFTFGCL